MAGYDPDFAPIDEAGTMGLFSKSAPVAPPAVQEKNLLEDLRSSVKETRLPENIRRVALNELDKLERTDPSIAEYGLGLNYVELLLSLPWLRSSQDALDLARAAEVLEREHFGLVQVKQRVLEYLAANIRCHMRRATVLCSTPRRRAAPARVRVRASSRK